MKTIAAEISWLGGFTLAANLKFSYYALITKFEFC